MISYKTLNKDNPKLNCRLKKMEKFSPIRIILDNKLDLNVIKAIYLKRQHKTNTVLFFIMRQITQKFLNLKKIKLHLIKSKINK